MTWHDCVNFWNLWIPCLNSRKGKWPLNDCLSSLFFFFKFHTDCEQRFFFTVFPHINYDSVIDSKLIILGSEDDIGTEILCHLSLMHSSKIEMQFSFFLKESLWLLYGRSFIGSRQSCSLSDVMQPLWSEWWSSALQRSKENGNFTE